MKQLTEEELEVLQGCVTKYNNVKIKIADTLILQDSLLKEIDSLKSVYMAEEHKLIQKYGDDTIINVKTGEIKRKIHLRKSICQKRRTRTKMKPTMTRVSSTTIE